MIFSSLFSCCGSRFWGGRVAAFALTCGLALAGSGVALAQAPAPPPTATPTPVPVFPLSDILLNRGELGLASVTLTAQAQSLATPKYKSNGLETRDYDGYFQAASDTTKLAVLSDDGTSVSIDGHSVLNRAGQGQGFENFAGTFFPLSFTFHAGQVYHLRLRYTNTVHIGNADVDGITLFAYSGGGIPVEAPPSDGGTTGGGTTGGGTTGGGDTGGGTTGGGTGGTTGGGTTGGGTTGGGTTGGGTTGGGTGPPGNGGNTQATLRATATSSSSISLSWSPVAGSLYRGNTLLADNGDSTYSDVGLQPSTTYSYRFVAADTTYGSATANAMTAANGGGGGGGGPTTTPIDLIATAQDSTSIDLTWYGAPYGGAPGVLKRSASADMAGAITIDTETGDIQDVFSFTDTGLTPGTTYYYTLDPTGDPTLSEGNATETTLSAPAPTPAPTPCPITLTATAATWHSINLNWTQCSDSFASYKLYRSTDPNFTPSDDPATSNRLSRSNADEVDRNLITFTDDGLASNTRYYYILVTAHAGTTTQAAANTTTLTQGAPTVTFEGQLLRGNTSLRACAGGFDDLYAPNSTTLNDFQYRAHTRQVDLTLKDADGHPIAGTFTLQFEGNTGHDYGPGIAKKTARLHKLSGPNPQHPDTAGTDYALFDEGHPWGETLNVTTGANGKVSVWVLSSDVICQPKLQAFKTVNPNQAPVKIGELGCDFDGAETTRRFDNPFDPTEEEDTGWIFNSPRLNVVGDTTPAKVYLKFKINPSGLDEDGNWNFVNGHTVAIYISDVKLGDPGNPSSTDQIVSDLPEPMKHYAFVTSATSIPAGSEEVAVKRVTSGDGATPQVYVHAGSDIDQVSLVKLGAFDLTQWPN